MSILPCQRARLKSEAGFTLVELAIVMIIIGLLIGGVLKGQQLITNAQITAQVSQIKSIDAATTSFRDQYAAMAGDIPAVPGPQNRLPNCTTPPCNTAGNGDGKVDNAGASITFGAAPAGEQLAYWAQLSAAGLLTGINPAAANTFWGGNYPASKLAGGGLDVGWNAGGAAITNMLCAAGPNGCAGVPTGHYLALHGTANAGVGNTAPDTFMTANQADRIDTKIDDGQPTTGTVLAAGAAACLNGANYNEKASGAACSIYIQFQN